MKYLTFPLSLSIFLTYYKSPSFSLYSLLTTTTSVPFLHLLHILCILLILVNITQYTISYFYGEIRIQEYGLINDYMNLFLTDTLLVLSVFNRDINYRNMIIFFIILCIKNIQWISTIRNDSIPCNTLICITSIILGYCLLGKINLLFLFSFEFGIIALSSLRNILILKVEGEPLYLFLLEIGYLSVLLVLYTTFIVLTSIKYKVPLNVFRASVSILERLIKKCKALSGYIKICKELDNIPDTVEEGECIICQDERPNKKLRCGHVFHLTCLKTWCERQHFCPVCKVSMYVKEEIVYSGDEEIRGVPVEIYE